MFETSVIELSSSALQHNLKFIKKRLNEGVRLCSVVKGNAYGHGISTYVKMAMEAGVDYFAVHSAEEAFQIRNTISKKLDLFIMGASDNAAVEWAIKNDVEFAVFDSDRLKTTLKFAKALNKKAKIHIEVETGMRRTGFEENYIPELCSWLKKNINHIKFQGLFTHLAGAESQANHFRVISQINIFENCLEGFRKASLNPVYHHMACSAALINYPETQCNLVRVGILQYGYWPNKETHIRFCHESKTTPDLLKRVIKWSTKVMAVKSVSKGSFIGYGTTFLAHENMNLAVIPVGYAHGYSRNLSNIGSVLINGKLAPIVGTINMNSLTADISNCGDVKKGDEVVLIGKQNGKQISVNSFSEQSHQLNYELLTRLPMSIPRIINTL